jgi:dienelactone hydrolase
VEEEELANVSGPFSIAAAEKDTIFTTELRHKSETILIETKQPFQINLYSGVAHGFAMRGDLSIPIQKFTREQAFFQAVAWFNEHLS